MPSAVFGNFYQAPIETGRLKLSSKSKSRRHTLTNTALISAQNVVLTADKKVQTTVTGSSKKFEDGRRMTLSEILLVMFKHLVTIGIMYTYIFRKLRDTHNETWNNNDFKPRSEQISNFILGLVILDHFYNILNIPKSLCDIFGWLVYSTFLPVRLQYDVEDSPTISFRLVTRGNFPVLVNTMIDDTIRKCKEVGLENFVIEIVTDVGFEIPDLPNVYQIVVDPSYRPKNGTRFKARALSYANEPGMSRLEDDAWVVHLDEESRLQPSSIIGIVNFCSRNRDTKCIGTGLISYGGTDVKNGLLTVVDSNRVAHDSGSYYTAIDWLHGPYFGFRGSFDVMKVRTEKKISFDHGRLSSIAEDISFALRAKSLGYRFEHIDGVICEQSPYTVLDFIKQRKRWFQGYSAILRASHLTWKEKLIPLYTVVLCTHSLYCVAFFAIFGQLGPGRSFFAPIWILELIRAFNGSVYFAGFLVGNMNNFKLQDLVRLGNVVGICAAMYYVPLIQCILGAAAVLWALIEPSPGFDVIHKGE